MSLWLAFLISVWVYWYVLVTPGLTMDTLFVFLVEGPPPQLFTETSDVVNIRGLRVNSDLSLLSLRLRNHHCSSFLTFWDEQIFFSKLLCAKNSTIYCLWMDLWWAGAEITAIAEWHSFPMSWKISLTET